MTRMHWLRQVLAVTALCSVGWASMLTVTNSTFGDNSASYGGGIGNQGALSVINSTFSGNSAGNGGGISNVGTLTITNSTFSSNSAHEDGGGIYSGSIAGQRATLTVANSTFSGNSDAIANFGGTANVANTILANSTSGSNCSGTITDLGGNLDSGTSCVGNNPRSDSLTDTDPQLLPLDNYGGPTQTMALESTSPAIDFATCLQATDQRGLARPDAGETQCDSGAYEFQDA